MIDERHLNGTTGESKSYTVTNNSNACSTARNLYYEQLQEQSEGDWVKVVRCKDCKHYGELKLYNLQTGESLPACMENMKSSKDGMGYCSWAERREDAKTN